MNKIILICIVILYSFSCFAEKIDKKAFDRILNDVVMKFATYHIERLKEENPEDYFQYTKAIKPEFVDGVDTTTIFKLMRENKWKTAATNISSWAATKKFEDVQCQSNAEIIDYILYILSLKTNIQNSVKTNIVELKSKYINWYPEPELIIDGKNRLNVNDTIRLSSNICGGVWKSSDGNIAKIDNFGNVIGKSAGNVKIIYTYNKTGKQTTHEIKVTESRKGGGNGGNEDTKQVTFKEMITWNIIINCCMLAVFIVILIYWKKKKNKVGLTEKEVLEICNRLIKDHSNNCSKSGHNNINIAQEIADAINKHQKYCDKKCTNCPERQNCGGSGSSSGGGSGGSSGGSNNKYRYLKDTNKDCNGFNKVVDIQDGYAYFKFIDNGSNTTTFEMALKYDVVFKNFENMKNICIFCDEDKLGELKKGANEGEWIVTRPLKIKKQN